MDYELLIKQAEAFISKYIQKHANPKLLFHNLLFTQNTVSVVTKISNHYTLNEKDFFIVRAAAWFLNVGYYKDCYHPEEASLKIAEEFYSRSGVEIDTIEAIKKCIIASKTSAVPDQLPEQIIWDANTFYLGSSNFFSYNKLQFKEAELLGTANISKSEWKRHTILLMETHQFYTEYCSGRLNAKKQENLEKLRRKNPLLSLTPNSIDAMFEKDSVLKQDEYKEQHKEQNKDQIKGRNKTKESAERTIETMFRTTSVNSQNLSSQADAKANIMISVNAIIISVLLSVVVRKIEDYRNLIFPVMLILAVSLATIIFSILATRPNIKKRNFTEDDIKENKINMLFFGNFFTMDFNTYSNAMLRMMNEKNDLHSTLLRNIYEQGIVLAKKYRMLKISYNVFMYGLILSVFTFFIAAKYIEP